jgi:thymidylate synthase ThyX
VLPNATKTELIATYDLRMWRHVIRTRMAPGDSYGMHLVIALIYNSLSCAYPILFEDIKDNGSLDKAVRMYHEYNC